MLLPANDVSWAAASLWLAGILLAGFLVSWVATDLGGMRRDPYIAVLAVVTAGLTGAYLAWADVGLGDWITHHAGWGVLGGVLVAIPLSWGMAHIPPTLTHGSGRHLEPVTVVGVVYGIAEGVLLSVLPALVIWHATLGWNARFAAGALAFAASVAMIVAHHLGYWDYRNRQMVIVVFGCGLLTLSFLLTGSVLAPVIGHIAMHSAALFSDVELPPHAHPALHA